MNETELRRLASWDKRLSDVAQAEELVSETRRVARQAAQALADLRKEVLNSCPIDLDELAYRFWTKVAIVDDDTSCWEFTGSRRPVEGEEYGMFRISSDQKHPIGAHRVAFMLVNGYLPEVGRHTCDNPPCVRPIHIIDGTHADNMQDRKERGRYVHKDQRGESNGLAVLTDQIVIQARKLAKEGLTHAVIADRFRVKRETLGFAITGKTWAHLNDTETPAPSRPGGTRLTEDDVRTIRKDRAEGVSPDVLATRYGLTKANIYAIVSRKSWKHVV